MPNQTSPSSAESWADLRGLVGQAVNRMHDLRDALAWRFFDRVQPVALEILVSGQIGVTMPPSPLPVTSLRARRRQCRAILDDCRAQCRVRRR